MTRIDTNRPLRRPLRQGTRLALASVLAALAATIYAPAIDATPQQRRSAAAISHDASTASVRSLLIGGRRNSQTHGPWQVQMSQGTLGWISRIAQQAETTPLPIPGIGGTRFTLSLFVESTQALEYFTLFVPGSPAGVERPLLTCFHGYGTSHLDIALRTTFLNEADQRDWFLIAPFQLSTAGNSVDVNFASAQSQEHVEAVIKWVMQHYDVDDSRLYGVGFSMGGGCALSYAARHRDHTQGAFAAVVNHTGSVALSDVYANVVQTVRQDQMDVIFGGPPSQFPFEYQRSSVIDLDANGAWIPGGRHMAQNLVGVPVRTYYGMNGPLDYLRDQCIELDRVMQMLPGASHQLTPVPAAACGHCWDTIDETEVCTWLAGHSLGTPPTAGGYLIDRDGRWGLFDVETAVANHFAAIDYDINAAVNRITLDETENLLRVSFDVGESGLDPFNPLEVLTGSVDGTGDRIILRGLSGLPFAVTRNGVPVTSFCGFSPGAPTWCFAGLPGAETLELNEIGSAGARWLITP